MKKAQLSYEYLVIVGSVLILLLPFFYKFTDGVSTRISEYYAIETVNVLAEATKTMANLGAGNQITVPLTIKGVADSNILNNRITLKLPRGDIAARGARCIGASPDTLEGTGTFYTPVTAYSYLIAIGDGPVISHIVKREQNPNYNNCFGTSEINTNDEFDIYGANLGNLEQQQQIVLTKTNDKSKTFKQGDTQDRDSDGRTDYIRVNPVVGTADYYIEVVDSITGRTSNSILLKVTPPGGGGEETD